MELSEQSVRNEQTVLNRLALVTGASRGIGRAIAIALGREGWNLVLTCKSTLSDLEELASSIRENTGVSCTSAQCDMGDPKAVETLFRDHITKDLSLVVNNAGISEVGLLQDLSFESWNRIVATNLSSCFYTSKLAIPIFLSAGGEEFIQIPEDEDSTKAPFTPSPVRGRIVNISSVWGNVGASTEAAYSATKGGINSLTKALGKELAPSVFTVYSIARVCVDTVMNNNLTDEDKRLLAEEIPAGRFADPSEIAQVVLQLTHSPAYLTGQIITVDGGWI